MAASVGGLPAVVASGKDLMEPRLMSLCMNAGIEEPMMDVMGTAGITTVTLLKNTFKDSDDWRDTLTKAPFDLSGADFATKLKIGKFISVYESACTSNEVQIKADAERIFQNLPPTVTTQEILQAQKIFESKEFELTKVMMPSKGYYERMILQVETLFSEVSLTTVTNFSQDDINQNPNERKVNLNTGQYTQTDKQYSIPLPKTPEELRLRFRTLAVCWEFMRMKFPSKSQHRSAKVDVIDRYVEWLYGPKVWGLAQIKDGRPVSTPTIDIVIDFDLQLRKRQSELISWNLLLRRSASCWIAGGRRRQEG